MLAKPVSIDLYIYARLNNRTHRVERVLVVESWHGWLPQMINPT